MSRNILALNVGSSSLRYLLASMPDGARLAKGRVERLGSLEDHRAAVSAALDEIGPARIDGIAHRIVHGGDHVGPALVDDALLHSLDAISSLAPLHNPPALAAIRAARGILPGIPHVAIFDTSFHSSLPDHARTYAIDQEIARRYHIRRYGFHGISFAHVSRESARLLGRESADLRLVILHLGNGASAAAVAGGASIDTSMGFTPVEGLVMGTRSGDLDPSVVTFLERNGRMSPEQIDDLLNHRSGLLGIGGHSDMRDLLRAESEGSRAAALAVEVFLHRIRRYVGAYAAELGGIDALVFTGGIGENSAEIRERAVDRLGFLGIEVATDANRSASAIARRISPAHSRVGVLVVPTDEELEIARQAEAVLARETPLRGT